MEMYSKWVRVTNSLPVVTGPKTFPMRPFLLFLLYYFYKQCGFKLNHIWGITNPKPQTLIMMLDSNFEH
jgi:hypothetical protein